MAQYQSHSAPALAVMVAVTVAPGVVDTRANPSSIRRGTDLPPHHYKQPHQLSNQFEQLLQQ